MLKSDEIRFPDEAPKPSQKPIPKVDESEYRSLGDFFKKAAKMPLLPIYDFSHPKDITIEKYVCPAKKFSGNVRISFKGKPLGYVNIGFDASVSETGGDIFKNEWLRTIKDTSGRSIAFHNYDDFIDPNGKKSSIYIDPTSHSSERNRFIGGIKISEGINFIYESESGFPYGWLNYDGEFHGMDGKLLGNMKTNSQSLPIYEKSACKVFEKRKVANVMRFSDTADEDSSQVIYKFEEAIEKEAKRLGIWKQKPNK